MHVITRLIMNNDDEDGEAKRLDERKKEEAINMAETEGSAEEEKKEEEMSLTLVSLFSSHLICLFFVRTHRFTCCFSVTPCASIACAACVHGTGLCRGRQVNEKIKQESTTGRSQ